MKFTLDKEITYEAAAARMFEMLGTDKIMALASSKDDYVMVRNVSCLFYDEKIYFKTDNVYRLCNKKTDPARPLPILRQIKISGRQSSFLQIRR